MSYSDDESSELDDDYHPVDQVKLECVLGLLNFTLKNVDIIYIHYTFIGRYSFKSGFFVYDKRMYKDYYLKHRGEFKDEYPTGVIVEGVNEIFDEFMRDMFLDRI